MGKVRSANVSAAADTSQLALSQPPLSRELAAATATTSSSPPAPYLHPLLPADRLSSRQGRNLPRPHLGADEQER